MHCLGPTRARRHIFNWYKIHFQIQRNVSWKHKSNRFCQGSVLSTWPKLHYQEELPTRWVRQSKERSFCCCVYLQTTVDGSHDPTGKSWIQIRRRTTSKLDSHGRRANGPLKFITMGTYPCPSNRWNKTRKNGDFPPRANRETTSGGTRLSPEVAPHLSIRNSMMFIAASILPSTLTREPQACLDELRFGHSSSVLVQVISSGTRVSISKSKQTIPGNNWSDKVCQALTRPRGSVIAEGTQ